MRISKKKAAENRDRVVEAAAQLFRERGFERVSVADLMASAGLTHGGFYNHFGAKEDLEAAALARVFETSLARIAAVAQAPDTARAQAFAAYGATYLSAKARDARGAACPMVSFATDVSRQGEAVRAAYSEGLRAYLDAFAEASLSDRRVALRRFATMAGALMLARSVAANDEDLSNEILAAARME